MHKETVIAMAEWEQYFNRLQHGLIFDEDSPDVIDTFEDENCNKLTQNDAGSSQDKSQDRRKTHSLDECGENILEGLQAVPKHLNIDKRITLDVQLDTKKFPDETFNTHSKTAQWNECQSLCFCSYEDVWDSEKKHHEFKSVDKM